MNSGTPPDGVLPTSLHNTATMTTSTPISLTSDNSFQFLTTARTQDPLTRTNPSMINAMNDHSFYQQLLSQQQLQQLQQLQQQHNLATISQPAPQFTPYCELGLNLYGPGLAPISTSPISSTGTQHTQSANSTPPLSQDRISTKDQQPGPSTIVSNPNSASAAAQLLGTNQNLGHPYQHQLQLQNPPIPVDVSGRSENTPITSTADLRQASIYLSRPHLDSRDATLDTLPLHQGYPHLQQFAPSNGIGPQGLSSLHPNSSPSSTPLPSHQPEDHDISTADLPTAASTTPYDRKRSLQDESAPPSDKKSKYDTTQPSDQKRFTATSFQHMTREQLVDRLVLLENERVDLLQQQQQQTAGKKDKRLDEKASSSPVLISDDDIQGKKTDSSKTDEDDDEDDDDEESESISSVTDTTANDTTSNDTTEMRCLWKNCGETCVGVQGLTGHIVRTHVGGGKPLYYCEWENCRRIQKPFTKRHKIRNHLRIHTGERPFVCEKPGCEKRFSRPDSLVTHAKTHSTVRPFTCHIPGCEKAYYHIRSLRKHLKLHEEEEQAPQPLPYTFTDPSFVLQPLDATNSIHNNNKQMIDAALIDPTHPLFDPLAFQTLTALQTSQPYMHPMMNPMQQNPPQ